MYFFFVYNRKFSFSKRCFEESTLCVDILLSCEWVGKCERQESGKLRSRQKSGLRCHIKDLLYRTASTMSPVGSRGCVQRIRTNVKRKN